MIIGGLNILEVALGAIGGTTVQIRKFKQRTQNSRGQWITEYHDPVDVYGSWQPVDARTVKDLGLDSTKVYRNFYASSPIDVTQRSSSPDQAIVNGRLYDSVGDADWYEQNGWRGIIFVDVGAAE